MHLTAKSGPKNILETKIVYVSKKIADRLRDYIQGKGASAALLMINFAANSNECRFDGSLIGAVVNRGTNGRY